VVSIVPLDLEAHTKYIFDYDYEIESTQFKFQGFFLNYANRGDLASYLLNPPQTDMKQSVIKKTIIEPQNPELILDILYQISNGMHYMNKNNWIHRDLALRNILVFEQENNKFVYKITDFGLSLKKDDNSSICGDLNSTGLKDRCPGWGKVFLNEVDPEQIGRYNKDINWNYKSDIWSFGIIFWILIGGGDKGGMGMKKIYEKLFNNIYILLAKLIYGQTYIKGDEIVMKTNLFKSIPKNVIETYIIIEMFGEEIKFEHLLTKDTDYQIGQGFIFRILYKLINKLKKKLIFTSKKFNTIFKPFNIDDQTLKQERLDTIKNLPELIFSKDSEGKQINLNHKLFDTLLNPEKELTDDLSLLVENGLKHTRIDYFKQIQKEITDKKTRYPNNPIMLDILELMKTCFNPSEGRYSFDQLKLKFKELKLKFKELTTN